jgi:hypothetical protein
VGLNLYRTSYSDFRGVYVDGSRTSDGVGILLDGNGPGQCYFNVFSGCKVSGGAVGVRFQNGANANQWIGGKLGNTGTGMEFLSLSAGNLILGADFETNTGKHVYVDAAANVFVGLHMEDAPIGFHQTAQGWDTRRLGTTIATSVTTYLQDESVDGGGALDRVDPNIIGLRLGATKLQSTYLTSGTTVNADPITFNNTASSFFNFFRNVNTTGSRKVVIYKGDGASTPAAQIDAGKQNVHLADADAASGERVIAIRNYSVAPSTPVGGGVLYADGGALRFNTSSGSKVTVAGDVFSLAASTTLGATARYALVSGGASGVTITLGTATKGLVHTIKKIDSAVGAVTIATTASQTIDGATTKVLTAQYDKVTVVSDGSNWHII